AWGPEALTQGGDFGVRQAAVGAGREALVAERTDRDSLQFRDRMPDELEHPADLPVSALGEDDAEPRVPLRALAGRRDALDRRRQRPASIDRDPAPQAAEVPLARLSRDLD